MIRAVIFDFDGLIIDTETPWYIAYKEVFKGYQVDLPLEVWGEVVGTWKAAFDPLDYLQEQSGDLIDREQVAREATEHYHEIIHRQEVRPGVRDYLQTAKKKRLKIGLASSSNRKWVESYLSAHGLVDFFQSIYTADEVSHVKPDPELYTKTMAALGVTGDQVIAFEDSLHGLTAAKTAGAYCVIVPNPVTDFMAFEQADMKISSMEGFPLDKIIEKIERRLEKKEIESKRGNRGS